MGRRRRPRARRRLGGRALLGGALVALIAAYSLWGSQLRERLGIGGDTASPSKGAALRLVTWNLRNFPGEHQDLELVRQRLVELNADIIAVQEIGEPEALRALLPEWRLELSEEGGRGEQRLGVFFNPARVELIGEPREHPQLSLGGRVRPAFSAYLRARGGGPDFHLIVVHLKAMTAGYSRRERQWPMLATLAASLQGADLGGDADVIIAGDFNTTGPDGRDTAAELKALEGVFGPAGLRRIPSARGCSTYWDGPRRDAWQEPSLLDHIWVHGLHESMSGDAQARALGHCARHRCEAFRSTEAYPDLDFETVSDHCPVIVDLALADDD